VIIGVNIATINLLVSSGDKLMDNLALKYRPKSFSELTEQTNVVTILESMCKQENLPNRNFLLVGPRGTGKAQPLHSLVLTCDGFIPMRDTKEGIKVFTANGNIGEISGIYPQGYLDTFQITFSDGTFIEVSDEHINEIIAVYESGPASLSIVTSDLINLYNAALDVDTGYRSAKFYVKCPLVNWKETSLNLDLDLNQVLTILRTFERDYFYNSIEKRVEFFRKLLDLTIPDMRPSYTLLLNVPSYDKEISDNLSFFIRSLGCIDQIFESKWFENNREINITRHVISLTDYIYNKLFYPKVEDVNLDYLIKEITSITYIGKQNCQCIKIDHDDHTYISDGFTPTHNTTSGRIIANMLNEGVGEPIEVDAASNNGVEAIRNIVQQAQQYPIGCKYKVFILDEVHVLSSQSWQAMLKVLEEQPAKTVFVLLTTNPEKIPATIISRVQVFQLSNISLEGIESRLKYVIEQENLEGRNITYEDDAISFLAKLAKGGMRDALTLLDKALIYDTNITQETLKYSLNIPEYDDYFSLLNAYAKKDNSAIMLIISKVYNSGINFVQWFEGFQSFVINIAKYVFLHDINRTMIPSYYKDKISNYTEKHAQICLSLSQVLIELISKISKTEYMEEVALSYLCQRR